MNSREEWPTNDHEQQQIIRCVRKGHGLLCGPSFPSINVLLRSASIDRMDDIVEHRPIHMMLSMPVITMQYQERSKLSCRTWNLSTCYQATLISKSPDHMPCRMWETNVAAEAFFRRLPFRAPLTEPAHDQCPGPKRGVDRYSQVVHYYRLSRITTLTYDFAPCLVLGKGSWEWLTG